MTPTGKRIYVVDTSVLLADPKSMTRFEEHDVVLPVVVVLELESKRNHPELGWSARQALRQLEHWRVKHGNLTTAFAVNDAGGTLRVEINHQNLNALPPSLSGDSNDHRILAVAQNLAAEGNDITVEQRIAIDLLADTSIGIVSLGGPAGTGKSVLALAAGLESVLEQRSHKRVVVFRPLYAVGGQDLGYLPGSEFEKMSPWAAAVLDGLEAITGPEIIDEVSHRELLEVLPLTHIRGRSLTDTFVIIDEAQNLERPVLLTALSRLGEGSRVVLTHDVAQRDNLHVGRHDGIIPVIEALRGHPIFGHVTLTRSERSEIAAVVTELLDGPLDS